MRQLYSVDNHVCLTYLGSFGRLFLLTLLPVRKGGPWSITTYLILSRHLRKSRHLSELKYLDQRPLKCFLKINLRSFDIIFSSITSITFFLYSFYHCNNLSGWNHQQFTRRQAYHGVQVWSFSWSMSWATYTKYIFCQGICVFEGQRLCVSL